MRKRLTSLFAAIFASVGSMASDAEARSVHSLDVPLTANSVKKLQQVGEKFLQEFNPSAKRGSPRIVKRGRKPEIVLKNDQIYFNGQQLSLSQPLHVWRKKIGGEPRCTKDGISVCVWEEFGMEVGADSSKQEIVKYFNLYVRSPKEEQDDDMSNFSADGKPIKRGAWLANNAFQGYLELDGFGIDRDTKFWEVRSSVNKARNLRCGLRDCQFPTGSFGGAANIYIRLDGSNENASIFKFSIAR